jgi:hypothetical protein
VKKFTVCKTGTFLGIFVLCLCVSCSGLPSGKGWTQPVSPRGSIQLGTIRADKSSEWTSLEREIAGLLPLLLMERRYETADIAKYRIDAAVIEREYLSGWKTRRSLSAEVRIWKEGDCLPLSAGRVIVSGNKTFASSGVLSDLLRRALSKALRGLPKAFKGLPK